MDVNTNQFKLESLPSTSTAPAPTTRPTIPYAQFPRPTLHDPDASFDAPDPDHFDYDYDDHSDASAASSSTLRRGSFAAMDSTTTSQHRRRRSTLTSLQPPNARGQRPQRIRDGLTEELSWSQEEEPWSQDESKSNSDEAGGHGNNSSDDDNYLQDDEETGLTGSSRRQKRRRRNTLLDQRVAKESEITKEERKEADQNVIKDMAINGLFILLWYIFSLSISIYNKWMFSAEHLDFQFPLFTTCMHMLVQFSLASLVLYLFPRFRPRADSLTHPGSVYTPEEQRRRELDAAEHKPLMTRWFYFTRLGPCGLSTGLDIGLGNMSLQFISLTFYTMCKSSALAFVLIFAFLFRLETPSVKLIAIIATMTVGVVMMVAGEVDFSPIGFTLVISAAFFSGFRWALTQILLLRNPATSNPFASIFYLAPIMFLSLLAIAIPVEGPSALIAGLQILIEKKGPFLGPTILLAPGAIAFCMTASEFALLQRTSVVTLSIAGIFKEVVTILAAGRVFSDIMTPVNLGGLAITISAIAGYNYVKIMKMRQEALATAHLAHLGVAGHQEPLADDDEDDGAYGMGQREQGKAQESQGLLAQGSGTH
ncbi:hypothetical protein V500_03729 [Pseudogymnoascus sp. VKM F-4518 (FW-2643)]|nr:hypothetical protein V500_03729 [Pseudogymnoascus sp. VKM F-4518 (FW-2643)]KFZ12106.1 hypothetical protein V502_07269 [Pseudogymnoascus sp. VKM F-4520 (FW-2644)]